MDSCRSAIFANVYVIVRGRGPDAMSHTHVRTARKWNVIISLVLAMIKTENSIVQCPNLLEISKQGLQIVHLQYIYM